MPEGSQVTALAGMMHRQNTAIMQVTRGTTFKGGGDWNRYDDVLKCHSSSARSSMPPENIPR